MFKMVEAAGVESSQLFVIVRGHANSFGNLQTLFVLNSIIAHHHEEFLSRLVPSLRSLCTAPHALSAAFRNSPFPALTAPALLNYSGFGNTQMSKESGPISLTPGSLVAFKDFNCSFWNS